MKYGYAGIINFLIDLFTQSNNNTYLDYAFRAINSLFFYQQTNQNNYNYWEYNILSSWGMTGYMYGSVGIGETLIRLFELTANQTYLSKAIELVNWIEDLTNHYNVDSTTILLVNSST